MMKERDGRLLLFCLVYENCKDNHKTNTLLNRWQFRRTGFNSRDVYKYGRRKAERHYRVVILNHGALLRGKDRPGAKVIPETQIFSTIHILRSTIRFRSVSLHEECSAYYVALQEVE